MPIPFLLAGLGMAAGVLGVGGHLSAKETNEKAQRISQDAQELYNNAKYSLEEAQNKTEESLLKLGYAKKKTLDNSMNQFLNAYDKIKHIVFTESLGLNEVSNFTIDQQGAIQLRKLTNIYSSSIKSGATGAAAGAVVALAASGSLPLIGSELAVAGSFFGSGGSRDGSRNCRISIIRRCSYDTVGGCCGSGNIIYRYIRKHESR